MRPALHAALVAACLLARALPTGAEEAPAAAGPGETPESVEPARQPYLVEKIAIEGNTHTKESEIRKYLLVREGRLLDEQRILLSRLRLLQLGWFSRVETRVERGSERGRVVLVFTVTEQNTLIVTDLVLGSTGPQPLYGGFGLSEQNFRGLGLGLSGAFVYGGSPADLPGDPARFSMRGAFFDPDLRLKGMPPLVAGLTALLVRGEELTCADPDCQGFSGHFGSAPRLRYSRLGGEGNLGVRPGPFDRVLAGYRAEWVRSQFMPGPAGTPVASPLPFIRDGRSFLSALTLTYDRDTRNDIFFPSEGSRVIGQITFSSRTVGSDYEYSRYLLHLEKALAGPRGHAFRLLGALGAVQGDAPFFDRFYPADYAYFTLGPALGRALELNFSTDSRYDALLAMGGVEYGIPLWASGGLFRRGYLALGARWLWSAARPGVGATRASRIPFSGEVALRLDTPVGMFNVSAGYLLDNFL